MQCLVLVCKTEVRNGLMGQHGAPRWFRPEMWMNKDDFVKAVNDDRITRPDVREMSKIGIGSVGRWRNKLWVQQRKWEERESWWYCSNHLLDILPERDQWLKDGERDLVFEILRFYLGYHIRANQPDCWIIKRGIHVSNSITNFTIQW